MAEEAAAKWEGKVNAELKAVSADQVWPLLSDFCSLNRWLPEQTPTCYLVEGVPGQLGQIRYCAGSSSSSDGHDRIIWATEKLVSMDSSMKSFSYEIVDNNAGFKSYVGTIRLIDGGGDGAGCKIEWSFIADPPEGWRQEDLISYIQSSANSMAKRMEEALLLQCSRISAFHGAGWGGSSHETGSPTAYILAFGYEWDSGSHYLGINSSSSWFPQLVSLAGVFESYRV